MADLRSFYLRFKRLSKFAWRSLIAVRSKKEIYKFISYLYEKHIPLEYKNEPMQISVPAFRGRDLLGNHKFSKIIKEDIYITFIYPYFEKIDTILLSIDSIKKQKNLENIKIEIILIDDGSERSEVSRILPEDVLYLWRNKFKYGISRSRNLGAKIANGKILVFLDPDLILGESYIKSVLEKFQQFGERIVLTGYIFDYHFLGCEDPRVAWGVWENPNHPTKRFLSIAGGNLAIHRNLFEEIGGFDEDLIYGGVEDILFGYLLGKLPDTGVIYSTGMAVRHIPHPVGLAHQSPGSSWDVVARKYPDLYKLYVLEGMR